MSADQSGRGGPPGDRVYRDLDVIIGLLSDIRDLLAALVVNTTRVQIQLDIENDVVTEQPAPTGAAPP